jgi:hypothetical protein
MITRRPICVARQGFARCGSFLDRAQYAIRPTHGYMCTGFGDPDDRRTRDLPPLAIKDVACWGACQTADEGQTCKPLY